MICNGVYCAGTTPALKYAKQQLIHAGVTLSDSPGWQTQHLLLDVPSFRPGSFLSESKNLDTLLGSLPREVTIWGGNLSHPSLEGFRTMDLLKDEEYLAGNAAITAHCALGLAAPLLQTTWTQTPTLVIGWGRIGKCLGKLLRSMDCPVTISARSAEDRAALGSLGYQAADTGNLGGILSDFRLIFNTVPAPVISEAEAELCQNSMKIDLASKKGIAGEDVVWARGLPGIHAPESSGKLIADTFLRLYKEAEA